MDLIKEQREEKRLKATIGLWEQKRIEGLMLVGWTFGCQFILLVAIII